MEQEERFKNIMESALKEGINSVTLLKVIKELKVMIQMDELTVQANSKLTSIESVKDTVERYNTKTLDISEPSKTGLALSLARDLFR